MSIQTSYTQARANLSKLCDEVCENREIVIIKRRNAENVAMISASELSSILETAHLLRSPKNAERLLKALNRLHSRPSKPQSVEKLRRDMGLEKEK